MKVLMISTDRKFFTDNSPVFNRQSNLLNKYDAVHIIIFSNRQYSRRIIQDRFFLYPTRSWSRFLYIPSAFVLGFKIIRQQSITHITCQDPFETGLVGWLLKIFFKVNLELQLHTDLGSPYFYHQNLLNKIRFWLARFILSKADKVRVVSERGYDYVKKFVSSDKIYIKPIPVDRDKLISGPVTIDLHQKYPQFKKIILMVSRLEPEKNIGLAIKAMAKMGDRNIGLVIVGDGSERFKLERLAKNLDVQAVFEGQINDLSSYYKTADLFLHTSLYEGYGLVLVEAQICGLPIISTDVGIAREVGAIIASFSADELYLKIKQSLK